MLFRLDLTILLAKKNGANIMTQDSINLNQIIRFAMEKYLVERGLTFCNATKKQRGKAFMEFYIKDIGQYLYQFDEDFIDDGLSCDGANDLNIDFAYKNEDCYYVFQSKYKGTGSLERDEISGFFNIHSRLSDKVFFNNNANDAVKDIFSSYKKNSEVHYILFTNAILTESNHQEFTRLLQEHSVVTNKDFLTWEMKGYSELKADYKSAQSIDEPIPEKIVIPIEKIGSSISGKKEWAYMDLSALLGDETPYETMLCTIKGTVLKSLYLQYKERLFNYNIRGYLGLNIINKRMRTTIIEDPKSFYLYNNGISAICSKIFVEPHSGGKGLQVVCDNFQIINGAQTTCCIGQFNDDNKLRDVRVLLRITKTADIKKEKKGLNRKIIRYNNSQSIIKDSDFRSNDDIQLFLEKHLSEYTYRASAPYKRLIYLPKRQKISKRNDEVYLTMETLAKVLYAFYFSPNIIYANTKILFDIDSAGSGKYWKIFGENDEEASFWPESKVKEIVAISFLWFYISEKLKAKSKELLLSNKENSIEYLVYLAKWHFLWAYGEIIRNLYSNKIVWITNRIIDGKIFEGDNHFREEWFISIFEKILDQLNSAYIDSKEDNGCVETISKGFNFKNWLRNQKAIDKLKLRIKVATSNSFRLPE
jgi:hypothetical protein